MDDRRQHAVYQDIKSHSVLFTTFSLSKHTTFSNKGGEAVRQRDACRRVGKRDKPNRNLLERSVIQAYFFGTLLDGVD